MRYLSILFGFCVWISALIACPFGGGSPPIVNQAADKIDQTIQLLDQNSAEWQTLLRDLVDELKPISQDIANQVNGVIQRGTATAGVEFRCNVDFIGNRVKEDLQRISDRLQGKTPKPSQPVVCQIAFAPTQTEVASVNMGNRPNEISFYGYNFDITSQNSVQVVLQHTGGEISLQNWVNKPTHYLMTLITAANDGAPLCNLANRRVVIRWGGQELYSLGVIDATCPDTLPAPTPFPVKPLLEITDTAFGKFIGGFGEDREYGSICTNGYKRSSYQVIQEASKAGNCADQGWVGDDEYSCRVRVHYSIRASSPNPNPNFASCRIVIQEEGIQLPPPPPPPCLCR